ncbi:MAG: cytidylate kinase, partial [Rubritepida sp.]|nr:cytidylate kinase [Rubritepida sp.]
AELINEVNPDEVAAEMAARDARDAARDVAPLVPATDAVLLDTTGLDADMAFSAAVRIVESTQGK